MAKNHLDIVFENNHFVAINKPAGLLSIPDREQSQPSLKDFLSVKYGSIFTVHRLDKDTSGIIVFAKDETTHKFLSQLFESRNIEKYYQAIVHGSPASKKGTIEAPISEHPLHKGLMVVHRNGKPAITDYELMEEHRAFSLMQFQLHTGRTHQIRVHSKNIGHPIACDELYGDPKPVLLSSFKKKFNLAKSADEERPILNRLALHAAQLSFKNIDQNQQTFEAAPPKDLRALLQQLRKWNA